MHRKPHEPNPMIDIANGIADLAVRAAAAATAYEREGLLASAYAFNRASTTLLRQSREFDLHATISALDSYATAVFEEERANQIRVSLTNSPARSSK